MCGIAGQVSKNKDVPKLDDLLRLGSVLHERGPDHIGTDIQGPVGLVHTRLSIIDLSERGNQPMKSTSANSIITFNGEIYNFITLKKELQSLGSSFLSNSDTEILLQGYEMWGIEKLLQKIDGMFAFVLYDKIANKVYLCRDPFGKKPLYLYQDSSQLLFSSSIQSIWRLKEGQLHLNYRSLDYFLAELTMPQPYSIWEEIQQVEPSHYYTYDIESDTLSKANYWVLSSKPIDISLDEAVSETERLLKKSILKRTVADVSIGCFLSSGVDSGLVVALLASQLGIPIKTFTVGFENDAFSEAPDARVVANRYRTVHHEMILKSNILNDIERIINYYGEPFADSSAIPSYYIAKAIGKHVKVALSGDGGDELYGGYPNYGLAYRTDQYLKAYPNKQIRYLATQVDKVTSRIFSRDENMGAYHSFSKWSGAQRMCRQIGFSFDEKKKLYHEEVNVLVQGFTESYLNSVWEANINDGICQNLMLASTKTRLLNDYLVKVDRSSMQNSIEVRSPFLDKALAELAFSLPIEYKFNQGYGKFILKMLAAKYVDKDVFHKRKKGFGLPLGEWLRGDLRDLLCDHLLSSTFSTRRIFNQPYVERLLTEHMSQVKDHTHKLWSLLVFEMWSRAYTDKGSFSLD